MNGDQAMRAHSATLPGPVFDDPAWVTPKSLSESTVAIVTSAALYVSDDDIRFREGLDTAVADGETLSIIPAIAGG